MAATTYKALQNIGYQAGNKDKDGKADTRKAQAGDEFSVDPKFVKDLVESGKIEPVKAAKAAEKEPAE